MSEVTQILRQIQQGNVAAASDLLPLVYAELRRLARYECEGTAWPDAEPDCVVHEAYIRLVADEAVNWDGRSHFFAAAAEAMRRILIENARRRNSLKRGGHVCQQEFDEEADAVIYFDDVDGLLDLDAALTKLASFEPELAKLVELRYFAGLTVEETAQALGVRAYSQAELGFCQSLAGPRIEP